jgi:hypothetical protein
MSNYLCALYLCATWPGAGRSNGAIKITPQFVTMDFHRSSGLPRAVNNNNVLTDLAYNFIFIQRRSIFFLTNGVKEQWGKKYLTPHKYLISIHIVQNDQIN